VNDGLRAGYLRHRTSPSVVFSAISLGYAAMSSAATHAASGLGLRFFIIYNVVLALTLLLHGALFYTLKVDWLSVNSGVFR